LPIFACNQNRLFFGTHGEKFFGFGKRADIIEVVDVAMAIIRSRRRAMDVINLAEDETTVLHDVVKNYLTELHTEISYTDDRDFKAALKRRQEILQVVLLKLASVVEQMT